VLVLLTLPAVLLLGYFRGQPGPTPLTRAEKIGIPINLAAGAALLVLLFHGKELGKTTETVTLQDSSGRTVRRTVPKKSFRRRMAVFSFQNDTGDADLAWLGRGLSFLLARDLEQDAFVAAEDVYSFTWRIHKIGLADDAAMPLAFMQELASSSHLNPFVTGSIGKDAAGFVVTVRGYETERVRRRFEHVLRGGDLFALVDEASLLVRRDLGLSPGHIDNERDLPVAEITTAKLDALRGLIAGENAIIHHDLDTATTQFRKAIAADPTFAWAHFQLAATLSETNQTGEMKAEWQAAKRNEFKLSESKRFSMNASRLWAMKEPDQAMLLARQWVRLFPEDPQAHGCLASFLESREDLAGAFAEHEIIHKLTPDDENELLDMGRLAAAQHKYDQALALYGQYADGNPQETDALYSMASIYQAQGKLGEARRIRQKALNVAPDNPFAHAGMALVWDREGQFDKSAHEYEVALGHATTAEEQSSVKQNIANYYSTHGQWKRALDTVKQAAEIERKRSPIHAFQVLLANLAVFAKVGARVEAERILADAAKHLASGSPPHLALPIEWGSMYLFLELEDAEHAEVHLRAGEKLLIEYGWSLGSLQYYRGRLAELRGDAKAAIADYTTFESTPGGGGSITTRVAIGRCYRKLGDLRQAEAALLRALASYPSLAEAHYELALVYERAGSLDKARAELKSALAGWAHADPEYKLAAAARAKAATLGS
jgi:tetratricopeptide (TPR) repeat protein